MKARTLHRCTDMSRRRLFYMLGLSGLGLAFFPQAAFTDCGTTEDGTVVRFKLPSKTHVEGRPAAGMKNFDEIIFQLMQSYSVPACSFAASRNGSPIIERAYGLSNARNSHSFAFPRDRFRIASLTKPLTAVTILKLHQDGLLDLDTRVWDVLKVKYPLRSQQALTPGVEQITIRNLLQHTGGWDDSVFDPMFHVRCIADTVGVRSPAKKASIIRYMWSWRDPKTNGLPHPPGTKYAYCNFGYCLLGRVIEEITNQTYAEYVSGYVLDPMGINSMSQGTSLAIGRQTDEVVYYGYLGEKRTSSVFPPYKVTAPPYGPFDLEDLDANGGWIASAGDLVRFVNAVDLGDFLSSSTKALMTANPFPPLPPPPNDSYYGMGWEFRPNGPYLNWGHHGSLPGTTSVLVRTIWKDASHVSWAAAMNIRDAKDTLPSQLDQALWKAMKGFPVLPEPIAES